MMRIIIRIFYSIQSESSLTSTGYNYGSYSNVKVDELLEQGPDWQQIRKNDKKYIWRSKKSLQKILRMISSLM